MPTVKARERQRMRIRHRITLTIRRDAVGECDECHGRADLYDDKTSDDKQRMCADCWAAKSDVMRRANGLPHGTL